MIYLAVWWSSCNHRTWWGDSHIRDWLFPHWAKKVMLLMYTCINRNLFRAFLSSSVHVLYCHHLFMDLCILKLEILTRKWKTKLYGNSCAFLDFSFLFMCVCISRQGWASIIFLWGLYIWTFGPFWFWTQPFNLDSKYTSFTFLKLYIIEIFYWLKKWIMIFAE